MRVPPVAAQAASPNGRGRQARRPTPRNDQIYILRTIAAGVVRMIEFTGCVALCLPSQERGAFAREDLQRTLEAEGARVVMSTTIAMQWPTSPALAKLG